MRLLLGFREGFNPEGAWDRYFSPFIAIVLVGGLLYMLGLFARSGLRRALDWVLLHLPGVTIIYKALSSVFESLESEGQGSLFQRVVLVEFPHPGCKALGFVTRTLAQHPHRPDDLLRLRAERRGPADRVHALRPRGRPHRHRLVGEPGPAGDPLGRDQHADRDPLRRGLDVPPTGPILDAAGNPIAEPKPEPVERAGLSGGDRRVGRPANPHFAPGGVGGRGGSRPIRFFASL